MELHIDSYVEDLQKHATFNNDLKVAMFFFTTLLWNH
jgi:hypothetical protein